MLYSTIVQRNETGFNQIFHAAREFEEMNLLEAIIFCKFDKKKLSRPSILFASIRRDLTLSPWTWWIFLKTSLRNMLLTIMNAFGLQRN